MNRIILPPRQKGDGLTREAIIDRAALALLFEAGGEMMFSELWKCLPCSRRELSRGMLRQYAHGNIKRHLADEPLTLTAAAMLAMEAARFKMEYQQEEAA